MSNDAGLILGNYKRVVALVAPFLLNIETSLDDAPTLVEVERSIARGTNSLVVVLAPWNLLDALLILLRVVVCAHTLDASTISIHLLTKLVLGYTSAVSLEDVVWVTFYALALL